jgi:hypothetical protein
MMKLMEIFFEDKEKVKSKKKADSAPEKKDDSIGAAADRIAQRFTAKPKLEPSDKPIPSLAQLSKGSDKEDSDKTDPALKGLPKFDKEPEEHPFGDPDFEPGSFHKPDPQAIGKAADRITNKFQDNEREKAKQRPPMSTVPDKGIPSLAQLAKDAEPEEEPATPTVSPQNDPALSGMPNFDHMAEPEEEPFGDPTAGQNDFRTAAQKAKDVVGQGIKKGLAAFKGGNKVPANWEKDKTPAEPTTPEDDAQGMPSMAAVAQQAAPAQATPEAEPKATNGLQGKHWKWKPGQKVDVGFVKGLTVVKVDQYGAQLQAKNGAMYRFVPHRGLRKISN